MKKIMKISLAYFLSTWVLNSTKKVFVIEKKILFVRTPINKLKFSDFLHAYLLSPLTRKYLKKWLLPMLIYLSKNWIYIYVYIVATIRISFL